MDWWIDGLVDWWIAPGKNVSHDYARLRATTRDKTRQRLAKLPMLAQDFGCARGRAHSGGGDGQK
jgi:hypothetical protein